MSRIFALQALLIGLIYIQKIEWFLLLGIAITLGFIVSVKHDSKKLTDDERRFLRARSFLVYQTVALLSMSISLGLRLLDGTGIVSFTSTLGILDLVCLCVASAISMGMFPFHGWVLPFLGSPRATVFLPMLCIQTGLLFFFRIYAPIVSTYSHSSPIFVGIPVVGLLYSALLFFGESRLKRIPGNLYLNHVCLMAITVVGLDTTSYTAAILDGVNTMVATLGLIGLCAMLTSRFGVRGVISPTGLGSFYPEIAVCYLICVLSLVSFPGTLGFIEEEVLLGQAVGHQNLLVAAIAIALTLNGFSSFRLFARVFMGQPGLGQDTETGLLGRERLIIYSIVAVIVINGLAPSYIVDTLSHMGRNGVGHETSGH
jgi:NADH-quinone oxidoreductase subunit M